MAKHGLKVVAVDDRYTKVSTEMESSKGLILINPIRFLQ